MPLDDLKNAGKSGYTSKEFMSQRILDFNANGLFTHGFRGQALFSMGQMCNVVISSTDTFEGVGFSRNLNSEIVKPIAKAKGTTVKVTELFKNCPVRKKNNQKSFKTFILKISKYLENLSYIKNIQFIFSYKNNSGFKEIVLAGNENNCKKSCIRKHGGKQ